MTRISLLALGFLLGQAQAQYPLGYPPPLGYDPKLAVSVKTPAGQAVVVRGPQVPLQPDPDFTWRWSVQEVVKNRSGQFTAVLYSGAMMKYWDANVFLVRPDGHIDRLKNDTVLDIQWTADGRYLIGRGGNTVRLWNTSGDLSTRVIPGMEALDVKPGVVCVATVPAGNTVGVIVQRFQVPSLRPLGEYTITGVPTNRRFCR